MSDSRSIEVWLDEHRWNALMVALESRGSIEEYLQTCLMELYRSVVPEDQVKEIEALIQQEQL